MHPSPNLGDPNQPGPNTGTGGGSASSSSSSHAAGQTTANDGIRGREPSTTGAPPLIPGPTHATPGSGPTPSTSSPAGPGFDLTWAEADQALADFRLHYLPKFPFVVPRITTPAGLAAEEETTSSSSSPARSLFASEPFLLRVILLAACSRRGTSWQANIQRSIKAYIGQRVVLMGERRLEILQGMLIFIAWGNLEFHRDGQMTNLIHLAIGYAHSLGITKTRPSVTPTEANDDEATARARGERLDEERAFLGCYYLLSINSTLFGRPRAAEAAFENDKHGHQKSNVDRCLVSLHEAAEYPSDFALEKRVRLQQLTSRISEACPAQETETQQVPEEDTMKALNRDLEDIMNNIARNRLLSYWSTFNFILVRLYLPSIFSSHPSPSSPATASSLFSSPSSTSPPPPPPSSSSQKPLQYYQQATQAYLTAFLSLSPSDLLHQPFTVFAELLIVSFAACRLGLLFFMPSRPSHHQKQVMVGSVVNVKNELDRVCENLEGAADLRTGREEEGKPRLEDPLRRLAGQVRGLRRWYVDTMRKEEEDNDEDKEEEEEDLQRGERTPPFLLGDMVLSSLLDGIGE